MATENPESKRKAGGGGGGKLARSETVTVRLDPKLRYLAELAALKQRRTVSSFIEWAIEDTLSRECIQESAYGNDRGTTFSDVASKLWDVDDADRFAKLALNYPDLLTHEEQKRWKLIRENGYLWKGRHDKLSGEWSWTVQEPSFIFERLRDHWATFNAVAQGEADRSSLPTWSKTKPTRTSTAGFDDTDDIPF
jgi:predicted transcriptional regulator